MKNSLCTLLLVAMSLSLATAQTEKGRWTVGAQVGNLSYSSRADSKTTTILLSPSAGYFVAKNVVIGASVPLFYSYSKSTPPVQSSFNPYELTSTLIGLSPYVRVYFGDSKLRPFVNASVGYNKQWNSIKLGTQANKADDGYVSYGISAGAAYFINNNISLDAALAYSGGDQLNISDFFNNGLTQSKSIGLSVGFRLFLGR